MCNTIKIIFLNIQDLKHKGYSHLDLDELRQRSATEQFHNVHAQQERQKPPVVRNHVVRARLLRTPTPITVKKITPIFAEGASRSDPGEMWGMHCPLLAIFNNISGSISSTFGARTYCTTVDAKGDPEVGTGLDLGELPQKRAPPPFTTSYLYTRFNYVNMRFNYIIVILL